MGLPYVTESQLLGLKNSIEKKFPTFNSISKISDYLYEVNYSNLDYEFANEHFKKDQVTIPHAGCSSVRSGTFFGRNFDWFYNNDCDFVIRVSGTGKIPSIGVAGSIPGLTKDSVGKLNPNDDLFKLLPFYTLDGINESKVFINSNVVPQDFGKLIKSEPTEKKKHEMFLLMWPRFVLDNFTTALEACEYAKKYISFFNTSLASDYGYDIHFMIGDPFHTYVLEIINNKVEYKEQEIMTNFHIIPVEFNSNGKVYTSATQDETHNAMDTNHVTQHGSGLERYNIAVDNIYNADTKEGMVNLMKNLLNYNNSYTKTGNESWYSEFVGTYPSGNYTVKTPAETYEEKVMPITREWFVNRDRNSNPQPVWHTTHTSVYDIEQKKLYIYDSNEDWREHRFDIPGSAIWEEGTGEGSIQRPGTSNSALGKYSIIDGVACGTDANAEFSHVSGNCCVANNRNEFAKGIWNVSHRASTQSGNPGNTAESLGIGTDILNKQNAYEIMQNGDIYILGIGGYDGKTIEGAKTVQQVILELLNK